MSVTFYVEGWHEVPMVDMPVYAKDEYPNLDRSDFIARISSHRMAPPSSGIMWTKTAMRTVLNRLLPTMLCGQTLTAVTAMPPWIFVF